MTTQNRELAGLIDNSGNVTAGGNLTVSGSTTTVSSTVETHADPLIELNTGAGSNANDLGFVFERGSTGDNACIIWDESNDAFAVGTTTATGTSTGNMSYTTGDFLAGKVTVDNVIINGTTIGHTDDTDLMTVADGGLTVAGTIAATGVTTSNAGVVVDELTIDGDTITATDDFIIDATADIILDADGEQVRFKHAGTEIAHIDMGSSNLNIRSKVSDKDILFYGNDNGSDTLALTLDMSAAGAAIFTSSVDATNFKINGAQGSDGQVMTSTGSGVAWEDAGGVSAIDGLSDATTSETNSIMLGTATHGTINGAAQNTSVGIGAMDAITSAEYTVAVGYNAGTALTSGNYNTALGGNAFITATDGHSNTALGMSALKFTTSGTFNAAVGRNSLANNTVGGLNTAIGSYALETNVDGSRNTAVGYGALRTYEPSSAADTYNTAVGYAAGSALTTALYNTFVGANAGDTATTAAQNTAVGYEAYKGNTNTGEGNTAIGMRAMGNGTVTSADYNVAVGIQSGFNIQSASKNVMLGYNAGANLTTADDNVYIGKDAGRLATTGSGNVGIGVDSLEALTGAKHNNTAIGRDTMKAMTTGHDNVAIGAYALDAADSASNTQNICIGVYSGSGALDGYGNVFVGYQTGAIATAAQHNVAIGRDALSGLTTGDDNVCIGAYAGKDTQAVEGGVYNVFIGSKTRGTHPSHSSAVAIGYNIDAAPGQVAIGTSALGKVYNEFDTDAAWSQGSDIRLKKNINDSTLGLEFINDLRPVTYNWKSSDELPEEFPAYDEENQKDTDKIMTGLIAQEVKEAIDKSGVERFGGWDEDTDGIQQIKKELFVFPLINAVKELTAKVKELEKKLEG